MSPLDINQMIGRTLTTTILFHIDTYNKALKTKIPDSYESGIFN